MFITRWYEWQLRNDHAEPFAANFSKNPRPRRCGVRRHIAHGDRDIEAHRKPAGSNDADRRNVAFVTEQRRTGARWRPSFRPQPDTLTRDPHPILPRLRGRIGWGQLSQNDFGSRK